MFLCDAAVMGSGTSLWMNEVLAVFDNIVANVSNSGRLQEECADSEGLGWQGGFATL